MYITFIDNSKIEVIGAEISGSSVDRQLALSVELENKTLSVPELLNGQFSDKNIKTITIHNDDETTEKYTVKDVFIHKQRRGAEITLSCRFNIEN